MDRPALPLEELYEMRTDYIARGMLFDENVIRADINQRWMEANGSDVPPLPLVEKPEIIPESPAFARALRMEDRQAQAEFQAAQSAAVGKVAEAASLKTENAMLLERLAAAEAMLAAQGVDPSTVLGAPAAPAAFPAPAADPAPPVLLDIPADQRPTVDWTKPQVIDFANNHGLTLAANVAFVSKVDVLDQVLAQLAPLPE